MSQLSFPRSEVEEAKKARKKQAEEDELNDWLKKLMQIFWEELDSWLLHNTALKFTQNVKRHTLTCVSNNIIQHHQPFKLWLQLLPDVLWQRFCLKAAQPAICLTVTLHEQLKWAHLETSSMKHNLCNDNRSHRSVYFSKNIRSLTVLRPSFHTYKAIDK